MEDTSRSTKTSAPEAKSTATGSSSAIDIDSLKKSYELPHIWKIRRDFMLLHRDELDADRLDCLSSAFVNIELLGLKYPDGVMKLVKDLGRDVNLNKQQLED